MGDQNAAAALWISAPGRVELRSQAIISPQSDQVLVRTLQSGISRGTESLVFEGKVPNSEYRRMRAPFQDGDFPFPVKYGYAAVGIVIEGSSDLVGQRILALHPHQSAFTLDVASVFLVPDNVSTARAVLAPQIETALNATWDGAPRAGERIAVVGAGTIGSLVAWLCASIAGCEVTLVDPNPHRKPIAEGLGARFCTPDTCDITDCDLVFHASGKPAGLNLSIDLAGFEARIIELSWYGRGTQEIHLGGAFHSRRLSVVASQVGHVATALRPRWSHRRRLECALRLASDPRLECLLTHTIAFEDLSSGYGQMLADPSAMFPRIIYPE